MARLSTAFATPALALVLALAASGAAQARPGLVEIKGQALPRLSSEEGRALQGAYVLADGSELTVSQRGRALWAELDHGTAVPMRALSPTRLQSADGRLTLEFVAAANGSVHAVRVTTPRRG